jgi:hypothetical protein
MTITRLEQHVLTALQRGFPRSDPLLQALLAITDLPGMEVGVHVTLLVDGQLLSGNLMSNWRFTQHLDEVLQRTTQRSLAEMAHDDPRFESLDAWTKQMAASGFHAQDSTAADREADHRREYERLAEQKRVPIQELTFSDLTPELQLGEIAEMTAAAVLTLDNAALHKPLQPQQLGRIRVHISQISAWWVTDPQDADNGQSD